MNEPTTADPSADAAANAEPAAAAAVALPDRLAVDPESPHHVAAVFERAVGIRFNGKERHDVEEYCLSEGWIKVASARTKDRRGRPLLVKLAGTVEAYFKD